MKARRTSAPLRGLRRKAGFTLIELLVVIAIIALLVSILVPSLQTARELARRVPCATNLKQMSLGVSMYAQDNGEYIVPAFVEKSTNPSVKWRNWRPYWADFIINYFDGEAQPCSFGDTWSVGLQPADGNYFRNAPHIVYSKHMDCPGVRNADGYEYAWNFMWNNIAWFWLDNWTGYSGAVCHQQSGWFPYYWIEASPPTSAPVRPRKVTEYRSGFVTVIENCGLGGSRFVNVSGNWDPAPALQIAERAPHLETFNCVALDGSVKSYTQEFMEGWFLDTVSGNCGLPFNNER